MYVNSNLSTYKLAEQLQVEGYEFDGQQVSAILRCEEYCGKTRDNNFHLPPIISQELYDKAKAKRLANNSSIDKTNHYYLATKLIKCPICGRYYMKRNTYYACAGSVMKKCNNTNTINAINMDKLLLYIAMFEHKYFTSCDKSARIKSIKKEIKNIEKKIEFLDKNLMEIQPKIDRANELYILGKIKKGQYDLLNSKIEIEKRNIERDKNQLNQEINNHSHTINELESSNNKMNMFGKLTIKELYEIVHKYIKNVKIENVSDKYNKMCSIVIDYLSFNIDGEFELKTREFIYYSWKKKKYFENDECIDESIERNLGDLVNLLEAPTYKKIKGS